MSVKYPNYVNLTSSSEEQLNERTPSPPPRKKSLSPPQAPSKSVSSKSTHYTSSSSPSESLTPTHVVPPLKLCFVILIKLEPQELHPPQILSNDPYAQTMDNWPPGPSNPSAPLRVSRPPPGFPNPPPEFKPLPSTQTLFVNINNNTPLLHNNAPPLENPYHPPPNLRNQDFPNPPNILDFVHPNDIPHLHNTFYPIISGTISPIPPPLGANTGNVSSPNRVDTMPIDNTNNTTITNVAQNVVNEDLLQLLDSRGSSHVINVPNFDVEDFSSWKDRDTKIAALRLKFNAFKALKGEKESDSDVEEDTRSGSEFLADLNAEFHDRALLANQKGILQEIWKGRIDAMSKGKSEKGLVAESFDWDEESVSFGDKSLEGSRNLWLSLRISHLLESKVTLEQLLTEQIPGNIVRALSGRGKRKEQISSKEVLFTKVNESPTENASEITSNSESECNIQESLPPLPKLLGAEPTSTGNGYSLKDKNKAKIDKTEHGNGKSVKSQSQSQKVKVKVEAKDVCILNGPTRTQINRPS
ncbi:hypothetical protein Tco_0829898 [Tanacetum coccineum]